ncbi:hypothetical protein BH11BAC7_BH11BAC7_23810 [soil metagenome]
MAYILKSYGDSSYTWVNTISAEEKGDEEPGGCIKKSESPDAFEHLFVHNAFTSAYTQVDNFYSKRENQFPSSDFSEEVFFPPEVI